MDRSGMSIQIAVFCLLAAPDWLAFSQNSPSGATSTELAPGLKTSFRRLDSDPTLRSDFTVRPNVWLYVPAGEPASPFLPPGRFSAEWSGFVSLDLRSEYSFQATFSGSLKVELNGKPVLEAGSDGSQPVTGNWIRLNKGTNALTATYRSPENGEAFVRLEWSPKGGLPSPIPLSALTYHPDADLHRSNQIRLGRALVAESRCLKCHVGPGPNLVMPEISMDAPSFDGIGSRRQYDWLVRWILDPASQRPTARMPRVFLEPIALSNAQAVAAFLASLKETPAAAKANSSAGNAEAGKKLFETLHCAACHTAPDETDPARISLRHVRAKFADGALVSFLKSPEAHFAWTRMPNFHLAEMEAGQLAEFLEASSDALVGASPPADPGLIAKGRELVQTSGCLNCHALGLDNRFSTKALAEILPARSSEGCLADDSKRSGKAPRFALSGSQREAIRAFLATDRSSLGRDVRAEFAQRQIENLNCRQCHGQFDGFPPLDILGGKLKPEWTKAFLAGDVKYKPRPWIESRMPCFRSRAAGLAEGMAMLHGYPPQTPAEPAIDPEAVKVGQKLISAAGGFTCVACHAVGEMGATQVFESAGINLAYASERLLKPYFQRWLRNPLAIDSTSKMPVYFDEEGRSPLTDIFDGDGSKQVNAIWEYLRLGSKMPLPPTQ